MNEGVTQNDVYYKKVDDLNNVATKEELLESDQLILVKNDSAKRTSLGVVMDKMIERVTVPQYTINATPTNTDNTSSGALTASSEIIYRLTQGLLLSVSLTGVLESVTNDPWTLALTLTQTGQTLTYPIYTPDGVPVTNQYPLTNEVFTLVFLSGIQIGDGNTLTGWFIPDKIHDHDDRYYLTSEIDEKVSKINTTIIPTTRGGTGATNIVNARKNLGINPWVVVGNIEGETLTNSGYYKVFGIPCDTLKSCCIKLRISPPDNVNFSFAPVEISVIIKRSDTSKSTPMVYCNTGVDYYGILSKLYLAYNESVSTGNVELWYKNNSTHNTIKVSVFECSTETATGNSDGLEYVEFNTDNTPLDAIDSELTTVNLISDIVTEKLATVTSSGLLSAEGYSKLQNAADQDLLSAHINDQDNPHNVTKELLGLDKVDNTADADKEVKSAVSATNDSADQEIVSTYIKDLSETFLIESNESITIGYKSWTYKSTITFTKGDGTTGNFTLSSKYLEYKTATSRYDGLMSAADKETLDGISVDIDQSGATTIFKGNLQGNADSATKLGSDTVGSPTNPIYLSEGTPVECDTPEISAVQIISGQFTAGEDLAENDLIILDATMGTWFKSTTARTYAGIAMVATSSAAYAVGDTVTANVGMMRTVNAETVGSLAAKNLVLIQGTAEDDGVSFTTDGAITNVRDTEKSYIRAGYLFSETLIVLSGTNPQILTAGGSSGSSSTSSGLTSNDCIAGEDLVAGDVVLKDDSTSSWYKATTARAYTYGVSAVGVVTTDTTSGEVVEVKIDGSSSTITETSIGSIGTALPIYVRGRADGVKFTTDGTVASALGDGYDYIEIGFHTADSTATLVRGVPKVNYRYGIRTPVTTNNGYIHRNIACGTSTTPITDTTYGGSGSIYIYYT